MSNLKYAEKKIIEKLFGMASGYVLKFTDRSFKEFFETTVKIDIYSSKYESNGTSKAKRLRSFWEQEDDYFVGEILHVLLAIWDMDAPEKDRTNLQQERIKVSGIIERLLGKQPLHDSGETEFSNRQFQEISLGKPQMDDSLIPILESRQNEAKKCLTDAPLQGRHNMSNLTINKDFENHEIHKLVAKIKGKIQGIVNYYTYINEEEDHYYRRWDGYDVDVTREADKFVKKINQINSLLGSVDSDHISIANLVSTE